MKQTFAGIILGASAIAAQVTCNAGVYSMGNAKPVPHQPDEVSISSFLFGNSHAEAYVSTNVLSRQPKWDGMSTNVPLSLERACILAKASMIHQYPNVKSWVVDWITFSEIGSSAPHSYTNVWHYYIHFRCCDSSQKVEFERNPTNCPYCVVLLDGTVVVPRASHAK